MPLSQPRRILKRKEAVAEYLILKHYSPDQEVAGALFLDCRGGLICEKLFYRGGATRIAVEPRMYSRSPFWSAPWGLSYFTVILREFPRHRPRISCLRVRSLQPGRWLVFALLTISSLVTWEGGSRYRQRGVFGN